MDLRNSALVAVLVWAVGATVAAIGLVAFISNPGPTPAVAAQESRRRVSNVVPVTVQNQLKQQAQVARQLSAQVASLDRSLRQNRGQLAASRDEVEQLRREYDQSLDFVMELLEQAEIAEQLGIGSEAVAERPMDPTPQPPKDPTSDSEELTQLREQLAARDSLIEELEVEHEELLSTLLTRDLALRDETIRILVRLGPSAADEIAESLRHRDADVRIWAANILAKMGSAANATLGDLTIASRDEDPRVRAADEAAIKAVAD